MFAPAPFQQAQEEVFGDTNVFTSFAVPPDDLDKPYSYLPVPSMDFLKEDLQAKIEVIYMYILTARICQWAYLGVRLGSSSRLHRTIGLFPRRKGRLPHEPQTFRRHLCFVERLIA